MSGSSSSSSSSLSHISYLLTISAIFTTLVLTLTAEAQTTPSCAQSLIPCSEYLNSTNPPPSCCEPLKNAVEKELKCLCDLYNTPGLLKSYGINVTDALLLPKRCKLSGGLDSCVKASGPTSSAPTSPALPSKDKSGVSRIAGTGLLSILLVWLYVVIF